MFNINKSIRVKACLAYDILCNKNNYIQKGNEYKVKKKDYFYYVLVGDLDNLKKEIEKNKNLLTEKDSLGRTLLYLAARNGYYNICDYLLKNGSNVNATQKDVSTPLHGEAYYDQEIIVQLLLEYVQIPK